MKRRKIKRYSAISTTLVACALALACGGGGGGGGMMNDGFLPMFLGDPAGDVGMAAGATGGSDFEVQVLVDGIDDLFGAAFHVSFDDNSASFLGVSGADSILGTGATFQGALVDVDEIAVSATMLGAGSGLETGTGLLVTLLFRATAETSANRFTFEPAGSRRVKTCPVVGDPCDEDFVGVWTGGTMVATQ